MSRAADGSVTIPFPNNWMTAVGVGALAAFVYAAIVVVYSLSTPNVSVTGSPLDVLGISWLFCLGTVGVPVVLWFRYGLRAPLGTMGFILLALSGLTGLQILEGGGETPAVAFTMYFAPVYVVLYGIGAYAEVKRNERRATD